ELRLRLVHDGAHSRQPVPRFRVSIGSDADLFKGVQPVAFGAWHTLGCFPTADSNVAFTTEFGPEKRVDLSKPVQNLSWTKRDDYVEGRAYDYRTGTGASFAVHTIASPSARKATIVVSSDDGIQMWLNGSVVLSRNVKRTFRKYDADKVAVELEKGENTVLLKFSNNGTA